MHLSCELPGVIIRNTFQIFCLCEIPISRGNVATEKYKKKYVPASDLLDADE